MNFRQKITVILLLTLVLGSTAFAQLVGIPDPNLRAAVRAELKLPADAAITQDDMNRLTHLTAYSSGIIDLTGLDAAGNLRDLVLGDNPLRNLFSLENLTNLRRLVIHDCGIGNLNSLSRLSQLEELNVRNNPISDLTPLVGLTALKGLDSSQCSIIDISPLAGLVNLEVLQLNDNQIIDVRPISQLTSLRKLELQQNKITDYSPLDSLSLEIFHYDQFSMQTQPVNIPDPNLRAAVREALKLPADAAITQDDMGRLKHLSAYRSDIINLSGLESAKHLEELILGGNPISDLRPLTGLTNLWRLVVPNCQISDISPLSGLRQLVELIVRENPISDITPLVGLTELKSLDLGLCLIVDFSPLTPLTNLLTLQINHNKIVDIRLPSTLTSLRKLELQYNQIIDVRPLSKFTSLRHLKLQHNQIIDVRPLSTLTSLQHLELHHNKIINVRPLLTLTSLEHLELQRNKISDVRPLSTLTSLRYLNLQRNQITDYTPVDSLSLDTLFYDQVCEIPPLPLEPRLENRKYPSIAARWSGYGWPPVHNRPELSDAENIALHDLWFHTDEFGLRLSDINNTITVSGDLDEAIRLRDELRALNPNQVILMSYSYAAAHFDEFPEDSPYWIRNDDGTIFRPYDRTGVPKPYHGRIDFTHPDFQDRIVQWAVAVSKCGLYDGIFFDSWSEVWPIIVGIDINGVLHKFRSLEAEVRARLNIVQRIRAHTRPDFLIMGNTNHNIIPLTGPYLNGGFMEIDWPIEAGNRHDTGNTLTLKNSLTWLEANLREPRINVLEGKTIPNEPRDSPANRRWVRALTTLSLTHSNGYVSHNNAHDQRRDWHDFWDADLGRPIGPKAQLYHESIPELFIREFTNGWAVFNRSGEAQVITLPEEVQGVASGVVNTEHELPNLDGEMYLRVKPKNPADVNGDGVVNILDLTLVAQSFGTDKKGIDVNGDGVVNVFDLVQVAGAIGGGGAAPSAYSLDPSIISAADVEIWLAQAQGLDVGDANLQRGIRFLQQLLAGLTPKETALLPNYPNPFNPETWIPYRLAREMEVAITIYDTKGTLVRRLALGNQAAGYYAERGKAAYWDGRNKDGEAVASGIYIYQFRAGDYAASRRMVIVK